MESRCTRCKNLLPQTARFCGHCGNRVVTRQAVKERRSIQLIIAFYGAYLLYAVIAYAVYAESDSLFTEIALESVFILLTVLFTFFDVRNVFSLYNVVKVEWKGVLFSVLFPFLTGLSVYYSVDWLNTMLYDEDTNLFYDYMFYDSPFFWAFVFYVIIPPIFEELAFRGFLFNQLQIVTTPRITILATAFIFALIHFSLLSFVWIFPFGIVLGYLRHRYSTLWLGMLIHFIHNLIIVLLDYYYFEGLSFSEIL